MAKKEQQGTVKARVLVAGTFGQCDDVVEIDAALVAPHVGILDSDPAAVAYAESLAVKGE